MHVRDFGIFFIAVCAIYVSLQHDDTFRFVPAWYHQFETPASLLHHVEPPPAPIVADLNGDGKLEMIIATPQGTIVVSGPRPAGNGFAPSISLGEVTVDPSSLHPPLAMAVGYLTPSSKELVVAFRKQVLVVVTQSLRVLCYDHNLRVLWSQPLAPHFPELPGRQEIVVYVGSESVSKDDQGLVVVGAGAAPTDIGERRLRDIVDEQEIVTENLLEMHAKGRSKDAPLQDIEGSTRHFAYFAFEGKTGQLRWKHSAGKFRKVLEESNLALHAFHRAAEEVTNATQELLSCRDFHHSVLASLPHRWEGPWDSTLAAAHFERQKAGKGAQRAQLAKGRSLRPPSPASQKEPASKRGATSAIHKIAKGASSSADHSRPPSVASNVLVAHLESGVEVLHLYTGRPLCRLPLPAHRLHSDLDGDGVVESLSARGGDPESDSALLEGMEHVQHAHALPCSLRATAGIPPRLTLFQMPLCEHAARRGDASLLQVATPAALAIAHLEGDRSSRHRRRVENQTRSPPPRVVHLRDVDGGGSARNATAAGAGRPKRSLLGLSQTGIKAAGAQNSASPNRPPLQRRRRPPHLALVLDSRGSVTALEPDGELTWQRDTSAAWEAGQAVPTVKALALRPRGAASAVLVAGGARAAVLSAHGEVLAEWELPAPPLAPLQVLDFDADGRADVVLLSAQGVFAWSQRRSHAALPLTALAGAVVLLLGAIFFVHRWIEGPAGAKAGAYDDWGAV